MCGRGNLVTFRYFCLFENAEPRNMIIIDFDIFGERMAFCFWILRYIKFLELILCFLSLRPCHKISWPRKPFHKSS